MLKAVDMLGMFDAPTEVNAENTMEIEKHGLVRSVAGLRAVAKLSDAAYLLRIPAAVGALLDENFAALFVEKGFKLRPNMQGNAAALVVLVDLSHDAFVLRQNIDQLGVRDTKSARCDAKKRAFDEVHSKILFCRVEQTMPKK